MKKYLVKPIFLTPTNVYDWQTEVSLYRGKECMKHHNELYNMLDDLLGLDDWGARYANWLEGIGLYFQTDEGWWNATAVDLNNLQSFVDDWFGQDEELSDKYTEVSESIKKLPKKLRLNKIEEHTNVKEYLFSGEV